MSNDLEHTSKLIEGYFNQTLTPAQKAEFEKMLRENPQTMEKFETEKAIRSLIIEADIIDIRKTIQHDLNSEKGNSGYGKFFIWGGIIIVAGLISALFLGKQTAPDKAIAQTQTTANNTEYIKQADDTMAQTKKKSTIVHFNRDTETDQKIEQQTNVAEPTSNTTEENNSVEKEIQTNEVSLKTIENTDNEESIIPQKKESIPVKPYSCDEFKPIFSVKIDKASYNKHNGLIEIMAKDATWEYALDEEDYFAPSKRFTDLEAGTYTIFVKDTNNCLYKSDVQTLDQSLCIDDYTDMFNPNNGEQWPLPIAHEKEAAVKIVNKMHEVFFESSFIDGENIEWNGTDVYGEPAKTGLYKAIITYSNGETCISNVTVIR